MNPSKLSRGRRSVRGFTMVELLCAVVVLNLLVAGLAQLFLGQNKMVNSLEEWCEGEPVMHVVADSDPMARSLGVPATLSKDPAGRGRRKPEDTPYEIEVLEVKRRMAKEQASAVFLQSKSEEEDD